MKKKKKRERPYRTREHADPRFIKVVDAVVQEGITRRGLGEEKEASKPPAVDMVAYMQAYQEVMRMDRLGRKHKEGVPVS